MRTQYATQGGIMETIRYRFN